MYIETSWPRKPGDTARLETPLYKPTFGSCVRFWYHMRGDGIGVLNVYIKRGGVLGQRVWSDSGNYGDKWMRKKITVMSTLPWQVSCSGSFRDDDGVCGGADVDVVNSEFTI